MEVRESKKIHGLKTIHLPVHTDFRGEYLCTFNLHTYRFMDLKNEPVEFREDDFSFSSRGVLRGLHGDDRTWKLVQNLIGEIFLAVADMRKDSPTYLNWEGFHLGEKNRMQVLIPAGCANGHLCLTERCVFSYKQSQIYSGADKQFTIAWNEPKFKIEWPTQNPILSKRDETARFLD